MNRAKQSFSSRIGPKMGGGASTENKNSPDLLGDPPKCRWETNRRYGAFLSHFKAGTAAGPLSRTSHL
jgi:hypothetical protein